MDEKQIERAAKIMKIIRLSQSSGMDIVSIKLNCAPTYAEKEHARSWAKAFELAATDTNTIEIIEEFMKP
jgi:hypothetical protein